MSWCQLFYKPWGLNSNDSLISLWQDLCLVASWSTLFLHLLRHFVHSGPGRFLMISAHNSWRFLVWLKRWCEREPLVLWLLGREVFIPLTCLLPYQPTSTSCFVVWMFKLTAFYTFMELPEYDSLEIGSNLLYYGICHSPCPSVWRVFKLTKSTQLPSIIVFPRILLCSPL